MIVNTTSDTLDLNIGAVSNAISKAAGPELQVNGQYSNSKLRLL